jgi:hypothetical protein
MNIVITHSSNEDGDTVASEIVALLESLGVDVTWKKPTTNDVDDHDARVQALWGTPVNVVLRTK